MVQIYCSKIYVANKRDENFRMKKKSWWQKKKFMFFWKFDCRSPLALKESCHKNLWEINLQPQTILFQNLEQILFFSERCLGYRRKDHTYRTTRVWRSLNAFLCFKSPFLGYASMRDTTVCMYMNIVWDFRQKISLTLFWTFVARSTFCYAGSS